MQLQRQIDRLLAQRASQWHQILQNATDTERAEFVAWLKQSPVHVKEYLEAVYTDRVLDQLDAERLEDVDALLAQASPVTELSSARQVAASPAKRLSSGWKTVIAAGIAACAIALGVIYLQWQPEAFATQIGEQRTIQLPDASLITLNADSRIEVRLDDAERNIELQRGEALFTVAHDAQRPFRVQTRTAVVEAIGTQFNVYDRPDGTRISVLEGRVRIQAARGTETLGVGEEAQVRLDGAIERHDSANVQDAVSWRERRLMFVDTPLEEMVYEFNRYSRALRLRLENVPPGTHHYSGIFNAADPESLADLLSREPDLAIERRAGEIVIRGD